MLTSHFFKIILVKKNFTRCFHLQAVLLVDINVLENDFESIKIIDFT
jgi:hypothetical protein